MIAFWLGSLILFSPVLYFKNFYSNFGVKAAEINDRKFIRIHAIRMNLRSLAVVDLSELSRSKFLEKFLK